MFTWMLETLAGNVDWDSMPNLFGDGDWNLFW